MSSESWKRLKERLHSDPVALAARDENRLRRRLSEVISKEQKRRGLSLRAFATAANTSLSQVQRILSEESGGSLTLLTLFKVANALGLEVDLVLRRKRVRNPDAQRNHAHLWGTCGHMEPRGWAKVIYPSFERTPPANKAETPDSQGVAGWMGS